MYSQLSNIRLKPQRSANTGSHLATYQGQIIRKSICNEGKREKNSQRVVTQTSEKCFSIGSEMKKMIKQFRAPFKSNSPNMKKKLHHESQSNNNKLCFSSTNPKKKNNAQTKINIINKNITDTGPLIKKKRIAEKDKVQKKPSNAKNQQKPKKQQKKVKKLAECKSAEDLTQQKQIGTFDCTPKKLTQNDLQNISLIGQGTFGKVYKSKIKKTGQIVAVKKVFQDPKYKNREIQIVSMLEGEFTMKVLGTFTTQQSDSQYLNIIMQYYETDLYGYIKANRKTLTSFQIKLYSYQAFRGLMYIHSLKICHRDIKPHNLLVNNGRLVICDFGSAKILTNEPNLPYICSRCYRAPELIFGASHYTTMIDVWSLGCVLLQMINGTPLFIGESSIDHLIEVIKILGTPTKTQVVEMNPQYDLNEYKFPKIKKRQWKSIFSKADPLLLDLIEQILIYSPKQRLNAAEALAHQYYDQLRQQKVGRTLQKQLNADLFDFSYGQIRGNEHLLPKLIPPWVKFY